MQPTPEQARSIEQFATGKKLRINAYAGTGKTSTLTLLSRSTNKFGTYLAFNKSIAADAAAKFPRNVKCSTVHSLAFRSIANRGYSPDKMTNGLNASFLAPKCKYKGFIAGNERDPVRVTERGYAFLVLDTLQRWQRSAAAELTDWHAVLPPRFEVLDHKEYLSIKAKIARDARLLWDRMVDVKSDMPLGHDGYLKLWALGRPTIPGDFLLLDEAQDTNGVVLEVVRNQGCQVIAVGDKHQQIYEWRGALNAMVELPADVEARLSMSFRFGTAIADYATGILQLLGESVPLTGNPDRPGAVLSQGMDEPDTILCRTNSQLLAELSKALEAKRYPYIVGGVTELQTYIRAVQKLMAGQPVESPLDFFGFENWDAVREASESEDGSDLRRWVKLVDDYGADELYGMLYALPKSEADGDLILSTGHKAKGREWDNVRLCDDFLLGVSTSEPKEDGYLPSPVDKVRPEAELRLLYVAVTRGRVNVEVPPVLREKLAKCHGMPLATPKTPVLAPVVAAPSSEFEPIGALPVPASATSEFEPIGDIRTPAPAPKKRAGKLSRKEMDYLVTLLQNDKGEMARGILEKLGA